MRAFLIILLFCASAFIVSHTANAASFDPQEDSPHFVCELHGNKICG